MSEKNMKEAKKKFVAHKKSLKVLMNSDSRKPLRLRTLFLPFSILMLSTISVASLGVAIYSAVNLHKPAECTAAPFEYTLFKTDAPDEWNIKTFTFESQNVTLRTVFTHLTDPRRIDNCIQKIELSEFEYSTSIYMDFSKVISCADSSLEDDKRSSVHSVVQTKYITDQKSDADMEDNIMDVPSVTSPISYASGIFSGCTNMTVMYYNDGVFQRVISFA